LNACPDDPKIEIALRVALFPSIDSTSQGAVEELGIANSRDGSIITEPPPTDLSSLFS